MTIVGTALSEDRHARSARTIGERVHLDGGDRAPCRTPRSSRPRSSTASRPASTTCGSSRCECVILTTPVQPCGSVARHHPDPRAAARRLDAATAAPIGRRRRRRPAPRLIVTYSGRVADQPVNVAGRPLVNSAHTSWNTTNGRTPTAADFPFDRQGAPDSATATVLEPQADGRQGGQRHDARPDPAVRLHGDGDATRPVPR